MAKKEKKEGGTPKKVLTIEQLKAMGTRGNLVILARLAYSLGKNAKFAGSKWAGKTGDATAGTFYNKVGPGGAVLVVPTDSDSFKAALAAGRSAQGDIAKGNFTGAVAKFLDAVLAINIGGGGTRTRDYGMAADLKL